VKILWNIRNQWSFVPVSHCVRTQARRQDLAAEAAKNQKEGPKTGEGTPYL